MSIRPFTVVESELSKTPAYQAAHEVELAAVELDNEIAQDQDRIDTKRARSRSMKALARKLRQQAFDRYAYPEDARHGG